MRSHCVLNNVQITSMSTKKPCSIWPWCQASSVPLPQPPPPCHHTSSKLLELPCLPRSQHPPLSLGLRSSVTSSEVFPDTSPTKKKVKLNLGLPVILLQRTPCFHSPLRPLFLKGLSPASPDPPRKAGSLLDTNGRPVAPTVCSLGT